MRNNMSTKESRRFDSAPSHASQNAPSVERNVEKASSPALDRALDALLRPDVNTLSGGVESRHAALPCKHGDVAKGGLMASAHSLVQPNNASGSSAPPAQIPFATEAGHWYLPDGSPFYTVPNKSKPGTTRPVTITDAKKVGAVPSVTGITGLIKGEGLINYFRKQVFEATCKCPYPLNGETPAQHMARALAMAKEHSSKAADRGTDLHGAVERLLHGQPIGDRWAAHIKKLVTALKQLSIDLSNGESERSFSHPLGFGGKCDYHERRDPLVIDFKSKPDIQVDRQYGYDEHVMQIAAYSMGLGLGLRATRGVSVFVGEQDEGVLILEWPTPDLESAWTQFKHLLAIWQIRKKYCPAFGGEEKEL